MRHSLLRLSVLALLLTINTIVFADTFVVNGIKYSTTSSSTVELVSIMEIYSGTLVIPKYVSYNENTYSVTSIGRYALGKGEGLDSLVIPSSVKIIRNDAFTYNKLKYLAIYADLESLGQRAFSPNHNINNPQLHIDFHCKRIGEEWFGWHKHNNYATKVTMGDEVEEIGDWSFSESKSLTELTIGENVKRIGRSAFYQCSSLTNVVIPNNVTYIGDNSFHDVPFATLTLGNQVDSIGNEAFSWNNYGMNNKIETLTIPQSVTYIGKKAFEYSEKLKTLIIKEGSPLVIDEGAFENCQNISSVYIPNCVTEIGNNAFYNCI